MLALAPSYFHKILKEELEMEKSIIDREEVIKCIKFVPCRGDGGAAAEQVPLPPGCVQVSCDWWRVLLYSPLIGPASPISRDSSLTASSGRLSR